MEPYLCLFKVLILSNDFDLVISNNCSQILSFEKDNPTWIRHSYLIVCSTLLANGQIQMATDAFPRLPSFSHVM